LAAIQARQIDIRDHVKELGFRSNTVGQAWSSVNKREAAVSGARGGGGGGGGGVRTIADVPISGKLITRWGS